MAECMDKLSTYILEEELNEPPNNPLNALRQDVSELKIPFDKVRHEIDSKLTKGSECMQATEKLYLTAVEMTKTLEGKYTNPSNVPKEWENMKVKLTKTLLKEKVTLNVGGERYITSVSTLIHEKNSFFTELFSTQKWELKLHDIDKSIFIDRNGETFFNILEYLRTDVVSDDVLLNETLRYNLIIEAKYFRLQNLINILTEAGKRIAEEAERQRQDEEYFRVNNGFFANGTLLQPQQTIKLNEFYGKQNQRWGLIYKASRDGFDANAFHTHCNNQGPTMTIVLSNNNYLFGGYTSVAWTSDNKYKKDTAAFLFTLTNPHNIPPTKYLINPGSAGNAVYHHSSYGPYFGTGALSLTNNSNSSKSNIGFPNIYIDTTRKGNTTFTGASSFITSDIEVFKLA